MSAVDRNEIEAMELSALTARHLELSKLHRNISGLSTRLQRALRKQREQLHRLGSLEERIAKQKRAIHELEVCRAFEKETEELAEGALSIATDLVRTAIDQGRLLANGPAIVNYLDGSATLLAARKGPRP